MRIELTDDLSFIRLISPEYPQEIALMEEELSAELPNSYIISRKTDIKNTKRKFIDEFGRVPLGLWADVLKICKKHNLNVQLSPEIQDYLGQFNFGIDLFKKYVNNLFRDAKDDKGNVFAPFEHQIEAAYKLIKYKNCCAELSTSSGKTLISAIVIFYLFDILKIKKILYVVPNVDLATQSIDKYEEYERNLSNHKRQWKAAVIKSPMTKKEKAAVEDANFIFGTYQSLVKKSSDFLGQFGAVLIDEAHHAANKSIKTILTRCVNMVYSFGITGTFPKDTDPRTKYQYYSIESYLGPLVWRFTTNELINAKKATPVYIVFQFLNWATQKERQDMWLLRKNKDSDDIQGGTKVLRAEEKLINSSPVRLKYICGLAIKAKCNVLILFGDIKGGYGRRIYDYLHDYSEKNVYYADGSTKPENREWMKEQLELDVDQNTVLVASVMTFGEGQDLKNVGLIVIVSSSKSDRLVRQIVGRGLRLSPYKDKTVIIDIVDDLRYSETGRFYQNYMYKHYLERRKIYQEQKFPCYEQKITFDNEQTTLI